MTKQNNLSIRGWYESPKVEVISFDYTDVIATSGCNRDCSSHGGCTGIDDVLKLFNI